MNKRRIAAALTMIIGMTMMPVINAEAAVYNGWEKQGSYWYYYSNGSMKTGWINDGNWYYLKDDGTMARGWQNLNGTWYLLDSSGAMKTGWASDGGTWYYLNSDGSMKTGWLNDNGTWYYLNNDGAMKKGWLDDGGTWYYLNSDGSMKTGWLKDNGTSYYLNSNGAMQTGWFKDTDGSTYYFDENGAEADYTGNLFYIGTNENIYNTDVKKIQVSIENRTDHDYEVNIDKDSLQVYNEDKKRWVDVPFKDSNREERKITVKAHATGTYDINIDELADGKLEPGFYRVNNFLGKYYESSEFKVKEAAQVQINSEESTYYATCEKNSRIDYKITNNSDKKVTVSGEYAMQKYVDGKWQDVPLKSKDLSGESLVVEPHSTSDIQSIMLEDFDEEQHDGKYRIIKTIDGQEVYDDVYLYDIEF